MDYIKLAKEFRKNLDANLKATRVILERDLTEKELLEHMNVYDEWESLKEGTQLISLQYIRYNNKLYQVRENKGHTKQNNWTPDTAHSQFKEVLPAEVIPQWISGKGYNEGERVTHNGYIWISKNAGNISEPSTDSGHFRFWEQGSAI